MHYVVLGAFRNSQSDFHNGGLVVASFPDYVVGDKELVKRWRDFTICLATLVASVFEPMRFDAWRKEVCAFNEDGSPDESCWRRALNYITLIAARFQFISALVLAFMIDVSERDPHPEKALSLS